jgi:hypothetical protein
VKHLEEEMGELASHAEKRVADLVPLLTSDLVIVCWECDPTDGKRWYACSTCSY